jgi:hypothetical protein
VKELSGVLGAAQAALARALERAGAALLAGDLGQMERAVQGLLRPVGAAIVEAAVAVRSQQGGHGRRACGGCGRRQRLVGSARPRRVAGLVGDYCLQRPYYHCRRCKRGEAPLDALLGLGSEACSPGLAQVVCRLGIEASFAQAVDLVAATVGAAVDDASARRLVERLGVIAERDQALQAAWGLRPGQAGPEVLLVSVDGVLACERDGWHEVKVGRLGALGPGVQHDRKTGRATLRLGPSAYCVGREEADAFWVRVAREAVRAGLGRGVRTVVLLADGAAWIWLAGRTQLGLTGVEVVEIVDYYHACEHLGKVAGAVFARAPRRQRAWLVALRRRLRDQGVGPVLRALGRLRPRGEGGREEVRKALAYFTEHAARMDYPAFAARAFPIGSGAIESTCRHLVQLRAVQAGMRWRTEHLQAVLSLRALHRSGRWAAFWADRPLLRARTHRAALAATPTPALAPPAAPPAAARPVAPAAPRTPPPRAGAPAAPRPWQRPQHPWRGRPRSA